MPHIIVHWRSECPNVSRYHSAPTSMTTEIGKPQSTASPPCVEQAALWGAAGGDVKWLGHGRGQLAVPQDVQPGAACGPAVPSAHSHVQCVRRCSEKHYS